jgi:Kef-type K+ transport system membrane component KefB/nucleotide-binding universal stress UspA family protein
MFAAALTPLPAHAVFLLLVQLALLLLVARIGAELAKLVGLPSVVGELGAGIVLGPSVFGHFLPRLSQAVFPQESAQFHLLETVGTLGMVLLLLLTGLETDLKLLRNLGRAAFVASLLGMVVPFAAGFGLGLVMPDAYVAHPEHRTLFASFLATAMAISAMPVIAKILMDLDLTKRNIGLVILSAGVVDDTAGWLVLSVIAGAASTGGAIDLFALAKTVGYLVAFIVGAAFVVFPVSRFLVRSSRRFKTPNADLSIIVIVTLAAAAITERIGVHAVFGAFVVGAIFRQVPQVSPETVHRLESMVMAVLAPIFFGVVGLKVDLWSLGQGGTGMLAIVVGVACFGKLVGCTIGGLWGGLRFWEAFSIAVAMNARGAMELVVASIGLSLGILNQRMFSIIVVVAVFTSFLAPVLLRLTMRRVRMTDEEARRILEDQSKGVFDPAKVRLLVPTAGGPNALEAMRIASALAKKSDNAVEVLYVDSKQKSWWEKLLAPIAKGETLAGRGIDEHLASLRKIAEGTARSLLIRRVSTSEVDTAILGEARKGFDLLMMGASQRGPIIGGRVLQHVVEEAPCHVAIMRAHPDSKEYRRLFVPVDGGIASRLAAEFAVRYAEQAGAELTMALLTEERTRTPAYTMTPEPFPVPAGNYQQEPARTPEDELARISVVFRTTSVKPKVLHMSVNPASTALSSTVARGDFDLIVLGAENRAVQSRLFFGHDVERLIQQSTVALIVVVPNIAMLR